MTSADVRKVLEENGVPAEAIDAYFTAVIDYVDGKHVSEIDHEVMKGFIEEIYVVFKESGLFTSVPPSINPGEERYWRKYQNPSVPSPPLLLLRFLIL